MNNSPEYPNTANAPYDDEISIGELLQKLWKKRGLIVFLPLVCAGLTIASLLWTKSVGGERLSYYVELTGIKDGAYSNGVAFSPQDLLNPKVVNKLTDEFSLENPEEIGEHLRVQYGTPVSTGTLTEYSAALSANSKSAPE